MDNIEDIDWRIWLNIYPYFQLLGTQDFFGFVKWLDMKLKLWYAFCLKFHGEDRCRIENPPFSTKSLCF